MLVIVCIGVWAKERELILAAGETEEALNFFGGGEVGM